MRTQFWKDLLVETIAVFIGITLALIIENLKDEKRTLHEVHNYFSLIEGELARDTSFISVLQPAMEKQYMNIDSFIDNRDQTQLIKQVEESPMYNPPVELLNSLLSSNSFNSIYDSSIFNAISHTLRDFDLYVSMEIKINETQEKFIHQYIYPNKDPRSGRLEIANLATDKLMINQLIHLNDMYKTRYMALYSIQINYRNLLKQINLKLHDN